MYIHIFILHYVYYIDHIHPLKPFFQAERADGAGDGGAQEERGDYKSIHIYIYI